MRRKDREVRDRKEIIDIIKDCKVCRLGMSDALGVYIVPLNFGYECIGEKIVLYFHSASGGRKIEALEQNKSICVEMDTGHKLIEGKDACDYSYSFRSIIGYGRPEFIRDIEMKKQALKCLMKQQTEMEDSEIAALEFAEKLLKVTSIFKVEIESITGKCYQQPS